MTTENGFDKKKKNFKEKWNNWSNNFQRLVMIKIIKNTTNIKNHQNKERLNEIFAKQHLKYIMMLGHIELMTLNRVLYQDDEKYFFFGQVEAMSATLSVPLSHFEGDQS